MPPVRKKGPYHHGDLRRALIERALELVAEKGVDGLTLREAARRAGVTQAAPYRHFADKEALVAAVAEEGFRDLHGRIRRNLARAPAGVVPHLRRLAAAYLRFAVERPAQFRIMFGREVGGSHGFPGLWQSGQANYAELLALIEAGQRAGVIRGQHPRRAVLAAWSAVHGLAALLVDGLLARQGLVPAGAGHLDALAEELIGTLLEGLGPPPATSPTSSSRTRAKAN